MKLKKADLDKIWICCLAFEMTAEWAAADHGDVHVIRNLHTNSTYKRDVLSGHWEQDMPFLPESPLTQRIAQAWA